MPVHYVEQLLVPLYTRVFRPQTITRGPIPRHHDLERLDLARLIAVVRTRHGPIAAFVHRPAAPDCVSRQKKAPSRLLGASPRAVRGKAGMPFKIRTARTAAAWGSKIPDSLALRDSN